jgi:hypothetical protein
MVLQPEKVPCLPPGYGLGQRSAAKLLLTRNEGRRIAAELLRKT